MEKYPQLSEAIARILRKHREDLGLSKRKLAELARLERVYIIQLEQGKKQPTLNALFYVSEALGLEPVEFVRLVQEEIVRLKSS